MTTHRGDLDAAAVDTDAVLPPAGCAVPWCPLPDGHEGGHEMELAAVHEDDDRRNLLMLLAAPNQVSGQPSPDRPDGGGVCGARAAYCVCTLPVHEDTTPHACGHDRCRGQWLGTYADAASFRVVRLPHAGRLPGGER